MAEIVVKLVNGELAGKTAQSIAKEVNAAALALKKAEVGTKEWVAANKKLEETKQLQVDLKKQIEGTTEASETLKKAWLKLPGAQYFQQVGESFTGMKKGVGGLISQFGLLKTAIVSTGIGALVVILGSLISYLTSTQEGVDKLTSVIRPLQAVFEALKGVVQELGGKVFKKLSEAIQNPIQALKDLGQVLLDNVINRFKAFALIGPAISKMLKGDLLEGAKDLGNAMIQMGTGVENAIDKIADAGKAIGKVFDEAWAKGKRLDELQKSIEKQEITQVVRLKQLELLLKQQKDIVEDTTKSFDERRLAAEKALAIQQTMLNEELSLLDKRIEKMKIDQSLNDTSREQQKELAELEAKRLELQAKTVDQSIEFKKKIIEINTAEAAFLKAKAAEELAVVKNIEQLKLEAREEGYEKEVALINASTEEKIAALTGSEEQITEQRLLLEEIRNQQLNDLKQQHAEEAEAKRLEALELELAIEQNDLNEKLLRNQITNDAFAAQSAQNMVDFQAARMAEIRKGHGEESAEYQKARADYIAAQQAQADMAVAIKKQEMSDQLAAMQGSLGTFGDFFSAIASMQQQGTAQWKAFATTAAILSAIQGAVNAYTSTAAIPIVGGVLAPIAAGLALAAGMGNVRKIQQTKVAAPVKKARRGLVLRGPTHERGGIPIEAEGDEIIMTRGVYRNPYLRKLASDINVAGGGIQFAAGGPPINPYRDRPPISSAAASASANNEMAEMRSMIGDLVAAQDRRIDRIQVVNNATETQAVNDRIKQIQNDANV